VDGLCVSVSVFTVCAYNMHARVCTCDSAYVEVRVPAIMNDMQIPQAAKAIKIIQVRQMN
jgi:hypothetical protein